MLQPLLQLLLVARRWADSIPLQSPAGRCCATTSSSSSVAAEHAAQSGRRAAVLVRAGCCARTANTSEGFFSPADSVMARPSMKICAGWQHRKGEGQGACALCKTIPEVSTAHIIGAGATAPSNTQRHGRTASNCYARLGAISRMPPSTAQRMRRGMPLLLSQLWSATHTAGHGNHCCMQLLHGSYTCVRATHAPRTPVQPAAAAPRTSGPHRSQLCSAAW